MIALATSQNAMELSEEDLTLIDALGVLGVEAKLVDWTDEHFDWRRAELVVVRTTWDYHLRAADFLAWVERVDAVTDLVNPRSVLEWNTNKARYLNDLAVGGVPIVPTEFISAQERRRPRPHPGLRASRPEWTSVVVKPAISAGAYETLVFELTSQSDAAQAHIDRLAARGDVLVQPYLDGITVEGETSLVFFEGEFSHAVRKVPQPGDFRVQIEFGGRYTVISPRDEHLAIATQAVACAPELPLYARVDLVEIDGAPHVMELELIEPELFFLFVPEAAVAFADLLRERRVQRLTL